MIFLSNILVLFDMLAISPWQGGRLNHIYIVNVCIAFYPRRWMKRYRSPQGGRSQSTFILQISAIRKKWMVARENWELLEDAKCYFRILLRGGFSLPFPPSPFNIFTSPAANAKECTTPASFRGCTQTHFLLADLQQAADGPQRRARDTQRKTELFTFSKAGISSSHPIRS